MQLTIPLWAWPAGLTVAVLVGAIWGYIVGRYVRRQARYRAAHIRAVLAPIQFIPGVATPAQRHPTAAPIADRELARRVRQSVALSSARRPS